MSRPIGRPPGYHRPVEQRARDALIKSRGNLSAAVEMFGCSRRNVAETIERYPALQQLCRDLMEEEIDRHKGTLRKLAIEKEVPVAVLAFLNNKGRHRSWGRPADEGPVQGQAHYHLHLYTGKFAALDDDQLARLLAERRDALGAEESAPPMITVDPKRD